MNAPGEQTTGGREDVGGVRSRAAMLPLRGVHDRLVAARRAGGPAACEVPQDRWFALYGPLLLMVLLILLMGWSAVAFRAQHAQHLALAAALARIDACVRSDDELGAVSALDETLVRSPGLRHRLLHALHSRGMTEGRAAREASVAGPSARIARVRRAVCYLAVAKVVDDTEATRLEAELHVEWARLVHAAGDRPTTLRELHLAADAYERAGRSYRYSGEAELAAVCEANRRQVLSRLLHASIEIEPRSPEGESQ